MWKTWRELKADWEARGLRDDDVIDYIDVASGGNLGGLSVKRDGEYIDPLTSPETDAGDA